MTLPEQKLPARHPRYTYLTANLRTGALLEELPLGGVSYSKRLNDAGSASGAFAYTAQTAPLFRAATTPAATALYILRDGVAVWGGIIWARTVDHAARVCTLQLADLWSYFDHRRLANRLSYTNSDANAIARDLIANAQAVTGGDIGIQTPVTASGTPLTRAYPAWSYSTFAQLLTGVATLDGGPDIRFDITGTIATGITRQLLVGTPTLGRDAATSGLVLDYGDVGANLAKIVETEDGSTTETTHYALGPGMEASKLAGIATRADLIANGWPLLEGVTSRSDDSINQDAINSYAASELAAAAGLRVTLAAASQVVEVGTFDPGDQTVLDIRAAWWNTDPTTDIPGRFTTTTRITGYTVDVPDDGSHESTTFEFGQLLRSA